VTHRGSTADAGHQCWRRVENVGGSESTGWDEKRAGGVASSHRGGPVAPRKGFDQNPAFASFFGNKMRFSTMDRKHDITQTVNQRIIGEGSQIDRAAVGTEFLSRTPIPIPVGILMGIPISTADLQPANRALTRHR